MADRQKDTSTTETLDKARSDTEKAQEQARQDAEKALKDDEEDTWRAETDAEHACRENLQELKLAEVETEI